MQSQDHYRYYISDIDKELKRNFLMKKCVVPYWKNCLKNRLVLEIGGGPGYFAKNVKNICNLVNVDNSFSFLQEARTQAGISMNVNADAILLPFRSETFDAVVVSGLFVYLDDAAVEKMLKEITIVLKPSGWLLFNEPLEYVRWYKTYLRLFRLDFLEPFVNNAYAAFARFRGLSDGSKFKTDLSIRIRDKNCYAKILKKQGFCFIKIRPFFVNIAPPSIEKYFLFFSYFLAPVLTFIRKSVNNGLLVKCRKV